MVPELYQRGGKITGIAYLYQNQRMAGSVLGKSYSLPGLQKVQQVGYQPEKDFDSLAQMGYTRLQGCEGSLAFSGTDCLDVTHRAVDTTYSTMDEGERH